MNARFSGRLPAVLLATVFAAALPAQTATPSPTAKRAAPGESASASGESLKRGKVLFAKVVESLGGKEKVEKVRDLQTRGQITVNVPENGKMVEKTMEVQTAMIFPDHLSQQIDSPFGRLAMIATPSGAFIVGPDGAQDLPEAMREELVRQVRRVSLYLARKADDPLLAAAAAGTEKIGEIEAGILDVAYRGAAVRWFVDPKTGRILRSAHSAVGPDGKQSNIVSDYSDFRLIDGFPVPFRLEVTSNGVKEQTLVVEEVKLNPGLDAKVFQKPAPPPSPTRTPS